MSAQRRRTDLEHLFDRLNTESFDGRIAPCAVRRSAFLIAEHGCDGLYVPALHRIVIQRGLSSQTERRMVIHEMCHARLPNRRGHGQRFVDLLRRLAVGVGGRGADS